MGMREILVSGPKWIHGLARVVEAAANLNALRCVFRVVNTQTGPVVMILLTPAVTNSGMTVDIEAPPITKRWDSTDKMHAARSA